MTDWHEDEFEPEPWTDEDEEALEQFEENRRRKMAEAAEF